MTPRGIEFLKEWEGCRLRAYRDLGGIYTIGWGCTHNVSPDMVITPSQAEDRLKDDLARIEGVLKSLIKVSLNDNQWDAITSLSYNIGLGNFSRSTLLKKLNQGDLKEASQEFLRWAHVGGIYSPGLERRRYAERDLFRGSLGEAKSLEKPQPEKLA